MSELRRREKSSPFSSHEPYDPAKIYLFLFQTISPIAPRNVPSLGDILAASLELLIVQNGRNQEVSKMELRQTESCTDIFIKIVSECKVK